MDIRITQQPALLGLKTTHPTIELESTPAVLKRHPGSSQLNVERKEPRMEIDSSPSREALGYYGPEAFTRMIVEKGKQMVLDGIGRRAAEGSEMVDVHKNGFVIPDLAEREAWEGQVQLEIAYKPGPRISYTPGKVDVQVEVQQDKFEVIPPQFDLQLNWGHVDMYVRQQNYIDIEWTGSLIDLVL